jgi:hypothetical protein
MFRALFCSSSGGTVYTAFGIFYAYYSTLTLLETTRHNTHKNIPIAVCTVPHDAEQKSA